MKPSEKQRRFTAYHEAGHAVFSYIYGVSFRRIALLRGNEMAGHLVFEDFARVIEQSLYRKRRAVREEVAENAALIMLAGPMAARRMGDRSVRYLVVTKRMVPAMPISEDEKSKAIGTRILQQDYEFVIDSCRVIQLSKLPPKVVCTDEIENALIEAHIAYLEARVSTMFTDPAVWSAVEALAANLLQDQEIQAHDTLALLHEELGEPDHINCRRKI